jgi:hypothetical protein
MTKHLTGFIATLVLAGFLLGISNTAFARDPEIRLYKMTRDGHSEKYTLFGKANNPGCHNTPYTYHVYKVAVLAYKHCQVFEKKNCPTDRVQTAYWKNKESKSNTKMKQGTRWFLTLNGTEVNVASWSCELK